MALFVRLCDDCGSPVSSFQKSFFRNAVALVIAAAAWWRARGAGRPSRAGGAGESSEASQSSKAGLAGAKPWALLFARAALGTVGIFANFYALSHIDIAEGQTLNKTAPFFTVLFAAFFLRERFRARQLLPLAVAFAGVLFIAKPGFAGAAAFPLAMGLLGGVCAGAAYACVRSLKNHAVGSAFIVVFFSAFSCLASVPFMLAHFDPMNFRQVLVLFGAGAGAALGQFGITAAYGIAAPRDIAVYDYVNIPFTALFGFFLFGQVPDGWSVFGCALIVLAAFGLSRAGPDGRTSRKKVKLLPSGTSQFRRFMIKYTDCKERIASSKGKRIES